MRRRPRRAGARELTGTRQRHRRHLAAGSARRAGSTRPRRAARHDAPRLPRRRPRRRDPLRGRRVVARRVLVAATDKGVCAILLGDDPEALARELQDRFPKAQLVGADAGFEALVAQVVGMVEAPGRDWTCRWTCAARRSSSGSGRRCARSPPARPRATPRSRPGSAAEGGARGGPGLRREPGRGGDPLPPGGARPTARSRATLGRGAQARAAPAGGGVMTASAGRPPR